MPTLGKGYKRTFKKGQIVENKKTRNSHEFDRFDRSLPKRFHSTKHKCKFVESST